MARGVLRVQAKALATMLATAREDGMVAVLHNLPSTPEGTCEYTGTYDGRWVYSVAGRCQLAADHDREHALRFPRGVAPVERARWRSS